MLNRETQLLLLSLKLPSMVKVFPLPVAPLQNKVFSHREDALPKAHAIAVDSMSNSRPTKCPLDCYALAKLMSCCIDIWLRWVAE